MPLTTGSVAFVGFNADGNDNLAFVSLTDIPAGESIIFEDNEWNGTAFVDTNENAFVWTASAAVAAGTVVRIDNIGSGSITASLGVVGLAEGRGSNRGIGASNETIYAYQGTGGNPTTFLTAIANSGFSTTNGVLTNTGLTVGTNAIEFTTGVDLAAYNGTRTGTSFDELRSSINNPANWQTQDGSGDQSIDGNPPDVPFSDATFSVAANLPNSVNLSVSANTSTESGKTIVSVTATTTTAVIGGQTIDLAVSGTGITTGDYTLSGGTIAIADGQTTGTVTFTVVDDTVVEGMETAVLTIGNPSAGITLGSRVSESVTIVDNDASVLQKVGSAISVNGAEIAAFDPASKRLFVVAGSVVEIYTMDSVGALTAAGTLAAGLTVPTGTQAIANSVAVKDGLVAVAYAIQDTTTRAQQAGRVGFYEAATGSYRRDLAVGALPDMLTFSPDGKKVVTADEGEPNSYGQANSVDPEGSVSIIDLSAGVDAATVTIAGFTAFNAQIAALKAAGVRITGTGASVARDLEPEYIAFAADGKTARVTLQENNAIAVLDLTRGEVVDILPLGRKSFNIPGNGIDPSDRDNMTGIRQVLAFGLYQPDAIASFTANGQDYYVTANEGDARDYTGFSEEIRVGSTGYVLDPSLFPDAAVLKQTSNLGRLTVTNASGDVDGDGDFDRIEAFGTRSFSIWDSKGTLVFDSGAALEEITLAQSPTLFNSDGVASGVDSRSDNKGPEPEGVTIGRINGRNYAFIGLERTGDLVVYDVTSPTTPQFLQYVNLPEDVGTEGVSFIAAADNPTGKPILVTANEVSKTVSVFAVEIPLRIADIQGRSHVSPLVGKAVSGVPGIVTAVTANGFYLEDASPDDDDRTSDGIFVFTGNAPTVAVGDRVEVGGTVSEFRPGGTTGTANLSITQIVSPTIAKISSGNSLPPAKILGQDGRSIPTTIIDNDTTGNIETGTTTFDPLEDGIDFYESLEGMRVTIKNPISVSPTNRFGEIWVVADGGVNATGKTSRGGVIIDPLDYNPERIQIDDTLAGTTSPSVDVGAKLSDVTGIVSYSFSNYEVLPTTLPTVVTPSPLVKEVTSLVGGENDLTVATFNVENLDANENLSRFSDLAMRVVNNLKSPDIIALSEIQDNNGATNDAVVDASQTYQKLIEAIVAAGGPTYQYRQIDPSDDADGGEPGGNIRVGFLFTPSRVQFIDIPGGTATSNTMVSSSNGTPTLSASPGRIEPTNTAFNNSRKPLVGQFNFKGENIYIIANHFNSKGGDRTLFGVERTGVLASESQRIQQATAIKNFVNSIQVIDANANIIVAGDLNDFEFSNPINVLESASLKTLIETLPENERYTYNFEGNAQSLDHILVSDRLSRRMSGFDIVHINSEFASQDSDHDPAIAKFTFKNNPPTKISLTEPINSIIENSDTTNRLKIADISITDDGEGEAVLSLSGVDANFFEIDSRVLYLKAGTKLDFETKSSYQISINLADPAIADSNIVSDYTLNVTDINDPFILQLLHASDQEAGVLAIDDAPRFSAVLNALKNQDSNNDGKVDYVNTITLASGDAYIPGLFSDASKDSSLTNLLGKEGQSRADIIIQNELGFQAIGFGNHEFDLGTGLVKSLIATDGAYPGTKFPYLSSNLDFSKDANLKELVAVDGQEASTVANKIAKSAVITVNGEKVGIVGATTPTLARISSSGSVGVIPADATDLSALATEIQKSVDALTASGINKVVLLSHMQQIAIEQQLAGLLKDVDIIMAGGSNTRLIDSTDILRPGDVKQGEYPILTKSATGDNLAIINTDGNYKYVGRLVVEFDNNGKIVPGSIDPNISGAYATDAAGVARLKAESLVDPEVQKIADAVRQIVIKQDSNVFGKTDVFLNGSRSDVRTQETNLGNLTADANLAYAKRFDPSVTISIKNGGGIRNSIGNLFVPAGSLEAIKQPPDGNPLSGKPAGGISQPDLQSALSFNNSITLITLTAEQLKRIVEHGVAASTATNTPGQFPQVAGISFSFDLTKPAGDRIQTLAILNGDGSVADVVVKDGKLQGNKDRTFRTVTLGFLADGGDSYPFTDFLKENSSRANRIDLIGETDKDLNLNNKIDGAIDPNKFDPGRTNFARSGTEQDAFAEYLQTNFATTAFNINDADFATDTRIQRLDKRADGVLSTNPFSAATNPGIVKIGAVNNISQIEFTVTKLANSSGVNELVVFEIEDSNKQIDLQDILTRDKSKIIATTLANNPIGFGDSQTRTLNFNRNANLGFALIKNGTAADIIAGKNKDVILSTATANYLKNLKADGFELDFEGMKVTAKSSNNPLPLGANLQTGSEGELLDLRSQPGKVEATFSVFRDAAFNNEIYFYKVDDAAGNVGLTTTNPQEYINRALANLVKDSDGKVIKLTGTNGTMNTIKATIDGGNIIAPMIVVNGSLDGFQDADSSNDPQVYVPFTNINSGQIDRIRLLGNNTFGFEDLGIGSDLDYNDMVVKIDI